MILAALLCSCIVARNVESQTLYTCFFFFFWYGLFHKGLIHCPSLPYSTRCKPRVCWYLVFLWELYLVLQREEKQEKAGQTAPVLVLVSVVRYVWSHHMTNFIPDTEQCSGAVVTKQHQSLCAFSLWSYFSHILPVRFSCRYSDSFYFLWFSSPVIHVILWWADIMPLFPLQHKG